VYVCIQRSMEMEQKIRDFRRAVEKTVDLDESLRRQITTFFRCKIRDVMPNGRLDTTTTQLTIWRPTDEMNSLLKEGNFLKLYHLTAKRTGFQSNITELSSNRGTKYEQFTPTLLTQQVTSHTHNNNNNSSLLDSGEDIYSRLKRRFCDFSVNCDSLKVSGEEIDFVGCVVDFKMSGGSDTVMNINNNNNNNGNSNSTKNKKISANNACHMWNGTVVFMVINVNVNENENENEMSDTVCGNNNATEKCELLELQITQTPTVQHLSKALNVGQIFVVYNALYQSYNPHKQV